MSNPTEAQIRYLSEVADGLPGTRARSPHHKRMFPKLEKLGLIEVVRSDGLAHWATAYYARTEAGRTALRQQEKP